MGVKTGVDYSLVAALRLQAPQLTNTYIPLHVPWSSHTRARFLTTIDPCTDAWAVAPDIYMAVGLHTYIAQPIGGLKSALTHTRPARA